MNKKVGIVTLGCRVNWYESVAIAELLSKQGFIPVSEESDCDYYIVNTCAVTAESERKSRQAVRRAALKGKTCVIGCASQLSDSFSKINNVIYTGGCRDKLGCISAITGDIPYGTNAVVPMDGAPYEAMTVSGEGKLFSECRAFVKIQDGCNGKCTYCIIPTCRGSVRSRPLQEIKDEALRLVSNGYKEIILTGIETSAYNQAPLQSLIETLSEVDGLYRVRLGSLTPNIITEQLLQSVVKSKNFMPHFHLSLQSCCDSVLADMKRPYRKSDIISKIELIRSAVKDALISADIIVGFPGESADDFEETVNTLKELNLYRVHSFPYSEREGTPAATFANPVPKSERKRRNNELILAVRENYQSTVRSLAGKHAEVLVEKVIGNTAFGHTESFLEVSFPCEDVAVGDIVEVIINDKLCDGTVSVTVYNQR